MLLGRPCRPGVNNPPSRNSWLRIVELRRKIEPYPNRYSSTNSVSGSPVCGHPVRMKEAASGCGVPETHVALPDPGCGPALAAARADGASSATRTRTQVYPRFVIADRESPREKDRRLGAAEPPRGVVPVVTR